MLPRALARLSPPRVLRQAATPLARSSSSSSPLPSLASTFVDPALGLSPSAAEYLALAQAFARDVLAPGAAGWDASKTFPVEALRSAAGLGFGGLFVSEARGGVGLSRAEALPIIEALAGADVSTTAYLTIHNMVGWMVDTFGSEAQREALLPGLTSCATFGSYCLTEPGAGSDAASLSTRAERLPGGRGYALSGAKAFISGGSTSGVYVVMARTGGPGAKGISAFLVPGDAQGLSFGAQECKVGWNSQPTAAVFMDRVVVGEEARLGEEGQGFNMAMRGLNSGRLSIAACSIGGAASCLAAARDHVQTRIQFGKPLAELQSVQFTLADMAQKLWVARLAVRAAAESLDKGEPTAAVACAAAKREATEMGFQVCDSAMQLLGGYGYLKDYPIERHWRDVRVHRILEGTNQVMQMIVARGILG